MSFEPKIVGFLCNWCAYSAADLAGASRLTYPANLRTIRVMCTGRIEPTFVLKALSAGADGVLICGCHPGDCHYVDGNLRAQCRFEMLAKLLTELGVPSERVRLEWISAAQAERFVQVVAEMTDTVRALGPLNWAAGASPEAHAGG